MSTLNARTPMLSTTFLGIYRKFLIVELCIKSLQPLPFKVIQTPIGRLILQQGGAQVDTYSKCHEELSLASQRDS